MLFLFIITIVLSRISGKLYPPYVRDDLDSYKSDGRVQYTIGDPLWVIYLNNEEWLDAKLRLGSFADEEDFYHAFQHVIIDTGVQQSSARVKKGDPQNPKRMPQITKNNNEIKADIMKIINKFALSTSVEPDAYVSEKMDSHNPSIVLYFKGSSSCLIVKQGMKEWHYIITSMPFPDWFYEPHDTFEVPLAIPNDIKNTFYSALLRFLQLVLYHPI